MRTGKMEDMDEVVYRWFKQARAMSAKNILMEKAKHKLEGIQVFKGTLSKLSNTYLLVH